MIHTPATVEDQLVLRAIKEECPWETLPKRLQSTMGTKEEWHRRIIEHCLKKRLQWNTSFARKVIKEGEYYEEMMRYLRKNLALFPYHLAEYVCRVMRVSPFRYYCDMIFEVMKNEQPYDSIPNFSAADALRLTGIGRNEFIDIMNKCRSKKIMWKLNKSIVKEMLPTQPVDDFVIEPWWGVCLVNFTLEEFKKLSEEETATIDKICKEEANSFILFDPNVVKGLYQRGLVYFDAPVYPADRIKLLKLEGFVSNREQSYEDPIEELLYAVFVVSSGNSTIAELATTLQADLSQLQAAASFACRLGWAVKLMDPGSVLRDPSTPRGAPIVNLIDVEDGANVSLLNNSIDGSSEQGGDLLVTENVGPSYGSTRVALLVDANITSYLMMGSVSPGLKSHAVTLYEAGKLDHGSISDLCKDLSTLEGAKFEGELQEFANHAFSLRLVLECLTSGGITYGDKTTDVSYKLTTESSGNNEDSPSVDESSSMKISADTDTNEAVIDNNSSEESNCLSEVSKLDADMEKDDKEASTEKRKYNLDILRCESLAALSPATLDRLFLRDYDIVVSMIPLPHSAVLPGAKGPVHFGPPCHSSMTPWMKMVLYSTVACGPLSVVLMKGQYLRLLPAPLAGCEKALIWSWDGSSVGGLGSKFEGDLVKGSILLHCLNSLLKYSGVLVLPLSKDDLDEQGRIVTMDVPLPLKNFDGSIAPVGEEFGLSNEENIKLSTMLTNLTKKMDLCTVGYICLLRLFKETDLNHFSPDDTKYEWVPLSVDFGIPLFSPKLCNDICKRIVTSQLLQSDLHAGHHHAMQELRKKLRDTCAEYQAAGPAAKILHQREQPKAPSRLLMNYASGRWNPLVDPSSPISGASNDHHRIKLANRQRCGTEVLSFDGSILRSYALSPVHEAAVKPMEESFSASTGKAESDDANNKEVIFPGVNLLFDGCELRPFDIGACLQARQPICLIAEASTASSAIIK